jgi:hypothetical protein
MRQWKHHTAPKRQQMKQPNNKRMKLHLDDTTIVMRTNQSKNSHCYETGRRRWHANHPEKQYNSDTRICRLTSLIN